MLRRVFGLLLITGALSSFVIFAQDRGPISTDRPSFTNSPFALEPGTIQFEFGGMWSDVVGFTILSGPELLGRAGIFNRVELRVTVPNYLEEKNANGAKTDGFTDMTLGAKVQVSDPGSEVNIGVIAQATIPTGDDNIPGNQTRVAPELIGIVGTEVSPGVSIGGQVGLRLIEQLDENKMQIMATFILSGEIAENLSAFGEVRYDHIPDFTTYVGHTGLVYAISNGFQIDVHGGSGLNNASGNLFLGAGAAIRL